VKRPLTSGDFLAGAIFTVLGAAFFTASVQFEVGSARQMGPGFFPGVLAGTLMVLGTIQIVQSVRAHSRGEQCGGDRDRPAPPVRPALCVLGGLAVFAFTLQPLGLIAAAVLLVVFAAVAIPGRRWVEVVAVAGVLACFSALVFVSLLGVPMPLWPEGW
jgi:putative tricarboxylic transport membrane protein